MKVKIKIEKEVDIKTIQVRADVRYWEDANVNGEEDTEQGDNIPCKEGDLWCPTIDIDEGKILNWKQGTTADIHYKVCDGCGWELLDENNNTIIQTNDGYVPDTLCPNKEGYGDYVKMNIDENGVIADWEFDIEDFVIEN